MRLTDTVRRPIRCSSRSGVERQIEHHWVAGELEVTPFRTDFRAQQNLVRPLSPSLNRGRGAVTLDNGHPRGTRRLEYLHARVEPAPAQRAVAALAQITSFSVNDGR